MFERDALQAALDERYQLGEVLGRGGMGTVYAAVDRKHGRAVAIKVLHAELGSSLDRDRFLREIETLARLNHPHILPLHDSGSAGPYTYFVMPRVEGQSLAERLSREGTLSPDAALRIAQEVADALAYAHAHGVLHRDIKPANVLLHGGHALVVDFGIAQLLDRYEGPGQLALTQPGILLGTPLYMSPEHIHGRELDGRSDVYSLGCVLFEMLTGRSPSDERERIPEVPGELSGLVARALARNPADRYAGAEEFRIALERARSSLASARTLPQKAGSGRPWRTSPPMVRRFLIASGGTLLVLAGLLSLSPAMRRRFLPGAGAIPIRSLAVLPLANLSGDPSQEYFADGLTEELIMECSKIAALRVISRTSVMGFKGTRDRLPTIAQTLAVDAVVEGSVMKVGDHVRVSAKLVRARPENQLWAESYERKLRDVLALQAELAQAIAHTVQIELSPAERKRFDSVAAINPDAHEAYLHGRFLLDSRDEKLYREAIREFERATRIDPTYARAWAGLADAYYFLSSVFLPPSEAIPKARSAAERALALDQELADAHAALGVIQSQYDWEWTNAEKELRRALEINSSYSPAHFYYSLLLSAQGRFDEALEQARVAHEVDPLSRYLTGWWAYIFYLKGDYDEAIRRYSTLAREDPGRADWQWSLGLCYEQKGEFGLGISAYQKAIALGAPPVISNGLARAYAVAGRTREARSLLARNLAQEATGKQQPYSVALVYAGLDDRERAFLWLEESYRQRSEELTWIKVDPRLRGLRSDPRFDQLVQQMRLVRAPSIAAQ
jgi:serine/threonine-protein kinase